MFQPHRYTAAVVRTDIVGTIHAAQGETKLLQNTRKCHEKVQYYIGCYYTIVIWYCSLLYVNICVHFVAQLAKTKYASTKQSNTNAHTTNVSPCTLYFVLTYFESEYCRFALFLQLFLDILHISETALPRFKLISNNTKVTVFDSFVENLSVDGCAMVCEDVEEFHCLGFSYCDDQLGCWLTKSRPENVPAQQTVKQNSCYIYQRKANFVLSQMNFSSYF